MALNERCDAASIKRARSACLALLPSSALSIFWLSTPSCIARLWRVVSLSAISSDCKSARSPSPCWTGCSSGSVPTTKAISCPLASSESTAASMACESKPAPTALFRRSLSRSALSSALSSDTLRARSLCDLASPAAAAVSTAGMGGGGSSLPGTALFTCGSPRAAGFGAAQQPPPPPPWVTRTGLGDTGVTARGGVAALPLIRRLFSGRPSLCVTTPRNLPLSLLEVEVARILALTVCCPKSTKVDYM